MSKGNTTETDLLKLIFNATDWANIADDAATSPASTLEFALHTEDPGEAGDMTTNEIAYTSYARVTVARTSGGFTVSGNSATLAANLDFPAGTGGSGTATYFSVGKGGGSDTILYYGTITPNIVCGDGITPRLGTGSTITED